MPLKCQAHIHLSHLDANGLDSVMLSSAQSLAQRLILSLNSGANLF